MPRSTSRKKTSTQCNTETRIPKMPLSYADIIVPNGAEMDSDFFNRRYQLIVNAIAEALAAANLYGTTSKQLLDLGLSQVNGVLGPLLTKISNASTLGFLIGKSGSSV